MRRDRLYAHLAGTRVLPRVRQRLLNDPPERDSLRVRQVVEVALQLHARANIRLPRERLELAIQQVCEGQTWRAWRFQRVGEVAKFGVYGLKPSLEIVDAAQQLEAQLGVGDRPAKPPAQNPDVAGDAGHVLEGPVVEVERKPREPALRCLGELPLASSPRAR